MINSLREKMSGITAMVVIGLIAIPFAFVGVESIFLNSNRITDVATVDGEPVSSLDLERQISLQEGYLIEQMGDAFDASQIDRENLNSQVLEFLVNQKILEVSAREGGLGVSDSDLGRTVQEMPQFQLGNLFSEPLFRSTLSRTGYTTATFLQALEGDLIIQLLQRGMVSTGFVSPTELEQMIALANEARDFQYILVEAAPYIESIEIEPSAINTFFEDNRQIFTVPELVTVDYVQIDQQKIRESIEVSEEQIQEAYRLQAADVLPKREVAHILLLPESEVPIEERVAEIQDRLSQGEEFADLAAEFSEDLGSANFGGELGFTDGSLFPEPFEKALAQLDLDEVSQPVTTESGVHLIKLIGMEEGSAEPLEEVRDRLESEIMDELAAQQYLALLDDLRSSAFATDDLDQLLEDLGGDSGLVIETSSKFSRESGEGIAANELFRSVAFSSLVLEDGLNSEPIVLSDTTAVVINLNTREASRDAALDEVADQIISVLKTEQAATLTAEVGATVEERISAGESLEQISTDMDLDWQVVIDSPRNFTDLVALSAFSMELGEPVRGSSLQNGDYLVVKLDSIEPGSLASVGEQQRIAAEQELATFEGRVAMDSYLKLMRDTRSVEIR